MQLTNIADVMNQLAMEVAAAGDRCLRDVANTMLVVVKDRIHEKGLASDGSQIGVYSEGYMSVRTGVYKTNEKITKCKKKGETRNVGVFTKGEHKGEARPRFNRTSDTKVVVSLTGQTENDFSVQEIEGGYGLGFSNDHNFNKAQWVEETYKKQIYALTQGEKVLVIEVASTYMNNSLNEQLK